MSSIHENTSDESAPPMLLDDATPTDIAFALEANWCAYRRSLALATGVTVRDDAQIFWFTTGMQNSWYNAILRARVETDQVAATFASVRDHFAAQRVPWLWAVGRASTPHDLGSQLIALGMQRVGSIPGMCWHLPKAPLAIPAIPQLTIVPANDDATWRLCASLPPREGTPTHQANRMRDLQFAASHDPQRQQFLGVIDGKPVAIATIMLAAGVAGLYGVETLPRMRRRGIGTAMTIAALRFAQQHGYRHATLQASESGQPIYERLGFTVSHIIDLYALRT